MVEFLLMGRRSRVLWILTASCALAQDAPTPKPLPFNLDVASARPSGTESTQRSNVPLDAGNVYDTISPEDSRSAAGGLFLATHQAHWRFGTFAYKLSGTQELALRFNLFSGTPKSSAPFWVTGSFDSSPEYFDISARAPANTSVADMRLMMRALLADRFHLVVHLVSADAPVFALVVAKPGVTEPELRPHPSSDVCAVPSSGASPHPADASSARSDLPPVCGVIVHIPSSVPGEHFGGRAIPLSLFATSVPTMTGLAAVSRPVVDQTGLPGSYDFSLTWVQEAAEGEATFADNAAAFRNALKLQLGLELKAARAPISFLVVDHVDRPAENE